MFISLPSSQTRSWVLFPIPKDEKPCSPFTLEECDLRTTHELDKKEAEFQLERENFNIRYDALREEYELIIQQKDLEITPLRESLLKKSPRNNWWWAAGGDGVGARPR